MLRIKKFSKPFDKSVGLYVDIEISTVYTMHKKGLKFALVVELAKLHFTYIRVLK